MVFLEAGMSEASCSLGMSLPRSWPAHVKTAVLQAITNSPGRAAHCATISRHSACTPPCTRLRICPGITGVTLRRPRNHRLCKHGAPPRAVASRVRPPSGQRRSTAQMPNTVNSTIGRTFTGRSGGAAVFARRGTAAPATRGLSEPSQAAGADDEATSRSLRADVVGE